MLRRPSSRLVLRHAARAAATLIAIVVGGIPAGCGSSHTDTLPDCGNGMVQVGEECDDGGVVDGDGCSSECRREGVRVEDLASGLRTFRYAQRPGLGFCPQVGSVVRAEVTINPGADSHGTVSIVDSGDPVTEDCLSAVIGGACLITREIVSRSLTEAETERVKETFREVRIGTRSEPGCERRDPCIVQWFEWERDVNGVVQRVEIFDGPCAPQVTTAEADEIRDLFSMFVRRAERRDLIVW